MNILLIACYICCTSLGLVFIKMGTTGFLLGFKNGILQINFPAILFVGLSLYIVSFALWIFLLKSSAVSYIYPILIGLVYIAVMVSSAFLLKEPFTIKQVIGSVVILVGLFIINMK